MPNANDATLFLAKCLEVRAMDMADAVGDGKASARDALDLLELANRLGEAASWPKRYEPLAWLRLENNQG